MGKYSFEACIFDMDGVITKTAIVHADAWKLVFDEFLKKKAASSGEPFKEFTHADYLNFVDGKPRLKGIKSFLESRGIDLPLGSAEDTPDKKTLCALGNKKNEKFREVLETNGVEVYRPCIEFIKDLKKNGVKVGVVSSSKNCQFILQAAEVLNLFDTRVDGVISEKMGLQGKPEGDIFIQATLNLGTLPSRSVVFEDAIAGVQAGRNGGFAFVVGVARSDNIDVLNKNGADVVITSFSALSLDRIQEWFNKKPVSLFECWNDKKLIENAYAKFKGDKNDLTINPQYFDSPESIFKSDKKIVFFLDYDGTLTPIVDRPELAVINAQMRELVKKLSVKFTTAIVSGRMREDVEKLVGVEGIFYAGSHGFDIQGIGVSMVQPKAKETIPVVDKVTGVLKSALAGIDGVIIEEKKFSVAVHYRLVKKEQLPGIKEVVEKIVYENSALRLMNGKMVLEILPAIDWNKGKAVRWIMKALDLSWEDHAVFYIGDDTTDEDAFRTVTGRGVGILVSDQEGKSAAQFRLASPDEVGKLFKQLVAD
ncbi:MAG: trehalose-phosphatase [Candidatus Omnitrophica bacterium]|nr:trehalose-phosphatase [Candidatus Omnitrophota bacterium]